MLRRGLAALNDAAIGQHENCGEQRVDGQPLPACEMAVAAAEKISNDADRVRVA